MFPQTGVSALLNYSDSMIIMPAEEKTLVIGPEAGTEFLVTLYSKQNLDIQDVMRRFGSGKGSVNERLLTALDGNLLSTLIFNEREAAFTAEPDTSRAAAALIVAIEHE
jgi:hypothetical protein